MLTRTLFLPLALLLAFALPVQAEQYRDFGDYRIHYSAFKSDIIEPEIAKAHGLTRSRYRALINITVQKKSADGGYQAVHAKVEGSARDIYSKINQLQMKEIREGKSIYYLAELPITDEQTLTFDIRVIPEGEEIVRQFSFNRQFFIN